jgi:hypothetical protein
MSIKVVHDVITQFGESIVCVNKLGVGVGNFPFEEVNVVGNLASELCEVVEGVGSVGLRGTELVETSSSCVSQFTLERLSGLIEFADGIGVCTCKFGIELEAGGRLIPISLDGLLELGVGNTEGTSQVRFHLRGQVLFEVPE